MFLTHVIIICVWFSINFLKLFRSQLVVRNCIYRSSTQHKTSLQHLHTIIGRMGWCGCCLRNSPNNSHRAARKKEGIMMILFHILTRTRKHKWRSRKLFDCDSVCDAFSVITKNIKKQDSAKPHERVGVFEKISE